MATLQGKERTSTHQIPTLNYKPQSVDSGAPAQSRLLDNGADSPATALRGCGRMWVRETPMRPGSTPPTVPVTGMSSASLFSRPPSQGVRTRAPRAAHGLPGDIREPDGSPVKIVHEDRKLVSGCSTLNSIKFHLIKLQEEKGRKHCLSPLSQPQHRHTRVHES